MDEQCGMIEQEEPKVEEVEEHECDENCEHEHEHEHEHAEAGMPSLPVWSDCRF